MHHRAAMPWTHAAGLSLLAVYGPFVVMATYTLFFVACPHCKAAVWTLLPCAPGVLPLEAGRRWLGAPNTPDGLGYALALALSAGGVALLTICLRRRRWPGRLALAGALVTSSLLAIVLLAAIRA